MTLISDTKNSISKIILDISQMNVDDILVNATESKIVEIKEPIIHESLCLPVEDKLLTLVKKSTNFYKETGTSTLCLAVGIIEWEIKSKIVQTPILIIPIQHKQSKIKKEITFNFVVEEAFLNPFLLNYLTNEFELTIPDFSVDLHLPDAVSTWLKSTEIAFKYTDKQLIGNFHHHRYQIIKDLEGLIEVDEIGKNVHQIFGHEDFIETSELNLINTNLFPADNDQLSVFESVKKNNTVIQGPPGTGKSQVLANLIGKLFVQKTKTLVVSEKRVALEVLQNKLASFNLSDFTFISTSETLSNDFIRSLKTVWDRLELHSNAKSINNLRLSEQYVNNLQYQLNILNQKDLIGGVSFDQFMLLKKEIDFTKTDFISDTPTIKDWLNEHEIIGKIYSDNLHESLTFLNLETLKSDTFQTFDLKIKEWKKEVSELNKHFLIENFSHITEAIKWAAICQIIENESTKPYFAVLLPDSKEQKKYNKLKKKRLGVLKRLEGLNDTSKNWKQAPSLHESEKLIEALNSNSYFKRRKAKKRLQKLAVSEFVDPIVTLQNWIEILQIQLELSQIAIEFREIGVESLEIDILQIDLFLQQISKNEWEIYTKTPTEKRKKLSEFHTRLNALQSILKSYFKTTFDFKIIEAFESIAANFEALILMKSKIERLTPSSYRLIGTTKSIKEFEQRVFKSNWVKFESNFPELAKFKSEDIPEKINAIIKAEAEESELFAQQIEASILSNFDHYHQLLRTPSLKLTPEEKNKKQQLKKGKSILVKEFSKTKNHPSIRDLIASEAAMWIHLLKPIWLSNPAQVAKFFPLEKDFFDVIIFDEASQIPVENAIGSLHRGKRIIIAGDEQQMGPPNYFKSKNSEIIDLLHQGSYYWKTIHLKHHYRSNHPQLIAFSNKHFYNNSLIAYPSSKYNEEPIIFHYCENGIFDERENENEAKLVAELIEQKIHSKTSLGIVAFSEVQLNCIFKNCKPNIQQIINQKIEEKTLFFKALENVQGEECDHLIISLGYGKNNEGDFQMRFGPLNQKNGAKRLNVLLTRAKNSIDFVASVKAKDFKLSDNEAINLLRLFLLQIEENTKIDKIDTIFPFNVEAKIQETNSMTKIQFPTIYKQIKNANELVTFQRILSQRGWKFI